MTLWRGLVVSVLDFGTRGLGSIPGMAPILQIFFFSFLRSNVELLQTSNMEL